QGDADAPPDLLRVVVGDRVAVLDASHAGDGAGGEEQTLRQRRLPGAAMADQDDVADGLRLVDVHRSLSCESISAECAGRIPWRSRCLPRGSGSPFPDRRFYRNRRGPSGPGGGTRSGWYARPHARLAGEAR